MDKIQRPGHYYADGCLIIAVGAHGLQPGLRMCMTGGRDFLDIDHVWSSLDEIHRVTGIAELGGGCAKGADENALAWCEANNVAWRSYFADWDRFGTAAGSIRNQQMLDDFKPDRLVVFEGGVGTTDCTRRARKIGIERIFCSLPNDNDPFAEASRWG